MKKLFTKVFALTSAFGLWASAAHAAGQCDKLMENFYRCQRGNGDLEWEARIEINQFLNSTHDFQTIGLRQILKLQGATGEYLNNHLNQYRLDAVRIVGTPYLSNGPYGLMHPEAFLAYDGGYDSMLYQIKNDPAPGDMLTRVRIENTSPEQIDGGEQIQLKFKGKMDVKRIVLILDQTFGNFPVNQPPKVLAKTSLASAFWFGDQNKYVSINSPVRCSIDEVRVRVTGNDASLEYIGLIYDSGMEQKLMVKKEFDSKDQTRWVRLPKNHKTECLSGFIVYGSAHYPINQNSIVELLGR